MRAAEPVDPAGKTDVVPIDRSAQPRHPTPVYASRPGDSESDESSLDATLRGLPAQIAQWLIVFGALGLLVGGAKWWAGRGEAGAQPAAMFSAASDTAGPASAELLDGSTGGGAPSPDAAEQTDVRAPARAPDSRTGAAAGSTATVASNGTAPADYLLAKRVRAPSEVPYPRRLHDVQPTVPAAAAARQGIAVLSVLIDARGNVAEVEILRGIDADLDAAAVAAARQWKFAPTVHDGEPVAVYSNFTVRFGY